MIHYHTKGINQYSSVLYDFDARFMMNDGLILICITKEFFLSVAAQMKWRLREGQGEAIYEIGVGDDGFLHGLSRTDMDASLDTLGTMARRLGASVTVLRRRYVIIKPVGS